LLEVLVAVLVEAGEPLLLAVLLETAVTVFQVVGEVAQQAQREHVQEVMAGLELLAVAVAVLPAQLALVLAVMAGQE
jgi:hypothetical protein